MVLAVSSVRDLQEHNRCWNLRSSTNFKRVKPEKKRQEKLQGGWAGEKEKKVAEDQGLSITKWPLTRRSQARSRVQFPWST